MFECQLVPWDMVKHLPAKWCLVTAMKRDDTVDGTCCPGEDERKGAGHEDALFGPIYNSALQPEL